METQLTKISSLFLTGLIAGTFFYGTFCVLPAFYDVPSAIHLNFRTALMNHNKIIVMTLVILALIVLAIYCWQARKTKPVLWLGIAALIMTTISLVITRLGSVPINIEMKQWNPASPPQNWLQILKTWNFYNSVRTVTSIASFLCLLIAELWLKNTRKQTNVKTIIQEYDQNSFVPVSVNRKSNI
jgi:uncharacterized membrane protein